ncbi:hypothetical protein Hanom_Chr11g01030201 [Helianthus anomalus]
MQLIFHTETLATPNRFKKVSDLEATGKEAMKRLLEWRRGEDSDGDDRFDG